MPRTAWILAAALLAAGCTPRDAIVWRPVPEGLHPRHALHNGEATERQLSVLFAPVELGPLAQLWPEARSSFAFDLADRVAVLGKSADADGYASDLLPGSADAAWTNWPVAEAKGADYVALTTILEIHTHDDPANSNGVHTTATALAEMKVLDAHGNVVFSRKGRGDWDGYPSPKFIGPASKPAGRVAWLACSNTVGALLDWMEKRNQAVDNGPAPTAERVVDVEIASDPPGADVLVDGIFRGNTPCTLKLPVHAVVLRLERRGHEAWERKVVPDAGMKIKPVLDPAKP